MELTRREFSWLTFGGLFSVATPTLAQRKPQSSQTGYRGVTLGAQSYSFRDRPLDGCIEGLKHAGLTNCELWQGHIEPQKVPRDEMRKWRETVPLDEFRRIREKFDKAAVAIVAYNISFKDDFSDAEIERGFEMAQALGAPAITASANTGVVARVAPVAAKYKMPVGMHNHSRIDPKEFATPENFETAMKAGKFITINLDIGHFTAANFDAVDFLKTHHDQIVTLHIKDRKKNDGDNVPFGQGDTPIGPVLRLLRDNKWSIPANIEYEYKGGDTVDEVKRCLEYCRRQLDS